MTATNESAQARTRATFFAEARAGAVERLIGEDLATARDRWLPTLGGKIVNAGDFDNREDAVRAAGGFRTKCREWLDQHTEQSA